MLSLAALLALAACAPPGSRGPVSSPVMVVGAVTAAPTCPVEHAPPAPACSAQPVPHAVILIQDANGRELESVASGPNGTFVTSLPPGSYRLVPQPVEGLLGTPAPISLEVQAGEKQASVEIRYDTGIR
jgi:hypothetical protein